MLFATSLQQVHNEQTTGRVTAQHEQPKLKAEPPNRTSRRSRTTKQLNLQHEPAFNTKSQRGQVEQSEQLSSRTTYEQCLSAATLHQLANSLWSNKLTFKRLLATKVHNRQATDNRQAGKRLFGNKFTTGRRQAGSRQSSQEVVRNEFTTSLQQVKRSLATSSQQSDGRQGHGTTRTTEPPSQTEQLNN